MSMEEFDWAEETRPSRGHPVLAVLMGCTIIIAVAVSAPRMVAHQPLPTLLFAGTAMGLMLWLLGFVVTIRRASGKWKAGSLAILLLVGLAAGYGAHLLGKMLNRGDMTTLAEVEFTSDGIATFPRDATERGAFSRMFMAAVQANVDDRRAYGAEAAKLGMEALNSPYSLSQKPAVLGKCNAIGALKPMLAGVYAKRQSRTDALQKDIAKAPLPEDFKRGMRMLLSPGETHEQLDALHAPEAELLDANQALCVLLAKRSWSNQGGYFGFGSGADRAAFEAIDKRRRVAGSTISRLQRENRERALQGREIVRNALDGSIFVGE